MINERRKIAWRKYNKSHLEEIRKKSLANYHKSPQRYKDYQKKHRLQNNARTRAKYAMKKANIIKICNDCGIDKKIHVHHIDFNALNNDLTNLIYLCAIHHGLRHQR